MSRIGAIFAIAAAIAVGFAVMLVLDQRLGTKEKLRERLPVLREKPWLLMISIPLFEALLGIICLVMRIPEIAFYITGGVILGAAVSLIEGGGE